MKKNILKFIISILFIISMFFVFNTNSFAFSESDYVKAFNIAKEYSENNNLTYYDYVVSDDGEIISIFFLINENYEFFVKDFGGVLYEHCNYYAIFQFDTSLNFINNEPYLYNSGDVCYAHVPADTIIYSSFDILDFSDSIYFEKKELNIKEINYEINLSNTNYTNEPIVAYTNYFPMEYLNKYKVYISTDMEEWTLMNYSTLTNAETGVTEFRFNYKIFENGVYYFKFLDLESNGSEYITYTITTIFNDREEEDTSDNIPTVHANYKKCYKNEEELFHIYTQGFSISDIQKYECYYIKDHFTTNYSVWNKMDLSSLYDVEKDETTYHFYFHTPIDSENCTYYFVLYDYEKKEYGGYSTLKCDFNYMNMYVNDNFVDSDLNADTIEDNKTIGFYRQTNIYKFFKNHFGLLFFPVDMTFEFFERLSLIKEESPMITVPTVYEPFTRWSFN